MIKGVIFDVDGVILDSLDIWDRIPSLFLEAHGIKPYLSLNEEIASLSYDEGIQYLNDTYHLNMSIQEIQSELDDILFHYYDQEVSLQPFIQDYIDGFYKLKIPMCITTAGSKKNVIHAFSRLQILDKFEYILSCDEIYSNKNHPDIYRQLAKAMNINKEDIVVFEDDINAYTTAKKDGFQAILVDRYLMSFQQFIESREDNENSFNNSGK